MDLSFYDALIESVDPGLQVTYTALGRKWVCVSSQEGTGLALNFQVDTGLKAEGQSLRDTAKLIRSWNLTEAALGLAAINSYLNHRDRIAKHFPPSKILPKDDLVSQIKQNYAGRKIASIGHFPFMDLLREDCEVHILERNLLKGDYPDSACEFLLPQMDLVLVTASTLINKTIFRLAELCSGQKILIGPSTPFHPCLFQLGFSQLSGIIVEQADAVQSLVRNGFSKEPMSPPYSLSLDLLS